MASVRRIPRTKPGKKPARIAFAGNSLLAALGVSD